MEKLTQLDPSTGMGPLARKEGISFDAKVLHESFQVSVCAWIDRVRRNRFVLVLLQASLATLKEFSDKIQTRVDKIEFLCSKQQREHSYRVKELEPTFQARRNTYSTTILPFSLGPSLFVYFSKCLWSPYQFPKSFLIPGVLPVHV